MTNSNNMRIKASKIGNITNPAQQKPLSFNESDLLQGLNNYTAHADLLANSGLTIKKS